MLYRDLANADEFVRGERAAIKEASGMAKQTDPVCGMQIEESDAAGTSEHQGKRYHFCSTSCKQKFDESPEKYANQ